MALPEPVDRVGVDAVVFRGVGDRRRHDVGVPAPQAAVDLVEPDRRAALGGQEQFGQHQKPPVIHGHCYPCGSFKF
ncbi:hypothetical protein RZS08_11710 [Arthrospira platensis SPKY1]|nr:hypothetical protein [Arthrospira platensis SPKY1]